MKASFLTVYFTSLIAIIALWLERYHGELLASVAPISLLGTVGVLMLYLLSHLFRMIRVAILSLDKRDQILNTTLVHALTAFPSSLVPFKGGEVLRLTGFIVVSKRFETALALWLTERFFDVITLCGLIGFLYFFDVDVPRALRIILVIFFLASILGILAFFAVAKLFTFLNRYLVLQSTSQRALRLLIVSHHIQAIEKEIERCISGRLSSLFLTSFSIWLLELFAIFTFVSKGSAHLNEIPLYFTQALAGILPGQEAAFFDAYRVLQGTVLIALTLFALLACVSFIKQIWGKR